MTGFALTGYEVVELIGLGGGGEVWLGREIESGESVALKRLRGPAELADRDRLRREAAVLAGVQHPHVVRLRTVVSAGEDLVLVLDHAPGGSLAELLAARSTVRPGEVVTIGAPLAQALAAVHAAGLVHGDVSPSNVLFAADGRPLLSDLGVSRLMGELPTDAMGTDGFVAPEVLAGEPTTAASDVYGLGAVCRSALGVDAPQELTATLHDATETDPGRRPSAAALARAIFDALPALPVAMPAPQRMATPQPGPVAATWVAAAGDGILTLDPLLTHRVKVRPREPQPAAAHGRLGRRGRRRRTPDRSSVRRRPFPRRSGGRLSSSRASAFWERGRPTTQLDPRLGGETAASTYRPWRLLAVAAVLLVGGVAAVAAGLLWAESQRGDAAVLSQRSRFDQSLLGAPTQRPEPADTGGPGVAAGAGEPGAAAGTGRPGVAATQRAPSPTGKSRAPTLRPSAAAEPRWVEVMGGLDAARSAAFQMADPDALDSVYAPGSPARRRDQRSLQKLIRAGATARRVRMEVRSATPQRLTASRALLRVVDRMSAYDVVGPDGSVLSSRRGRGDVRWAVTLALVGSQWRVYDVARG